MNKDNKNTELDNIDEKLHISDVIVRILCLLPVIGLYFVMWLNQLNWYKEHSRFYNYWYIVSSLTVLTLYVYVR